MRTPDEYFYLFFTIFISTSSLVIWFLSSREISKERRAIMEYLRKKWGK